MAHANASVHCAGRAYSGRDCSASGRGRANSRGVIAPTGAGGVDHADEFHTRSPLQNGAARSARQRVIVQINATADKLRHELLADITKSDLKTCMKVLARVRQRAEESDSDQATR